jgi:hypothetical protein
MLLLVSTLNTCSIAVNSNQYGMTSECRHLLVDLAFTLHNRKIKDIPLQDPSCFEENDKDLK